MNEQELLSKIDDLLKKYYSEKTVSFVPGKSKIPLASPSYGYEEVYESIQSLVSTWITMGSKVRQFEKEFAEYVGVKYAIMVNSGSSANLLAFAILTNPAYKSKFQDGDEIITPALTWATTVYPIINNNLKPVFVDVGLDSYNLDPKKIESAITKRTKAIFPVHLLGKPADMKSIIEIARKHNLIVIEDSCEAHGAQIDNKKTGSFGKIATFSFFMSHHITTMEGGMLVTNDEEIYEIGKALRAFGWVRDLQNKPELAKVHSDIDSRFLFVNLGFNIRPTEIQGAFGIQQLKKLEKFIEIRRSNVEFWEKSLSKFSDYLQLPLETSGTRHVSFGYSILVKTSAPFSSKQLATYLESKNIEVRPIMAGNITRQPVSKLFDYRISEDLENSTTIMNNALFLPNHQDVGKEQREYIAECIKEFIENKKWLSMAQ